MLMALDSLMSKLHTWPFFCLAQFDNDCSPDKRVEPWGIVMSTGHFDIVWGDYTRQLDGGLVCCVRRDHRKHATPLERFPWQHYLPHGLCVRERILGDARFHWNLHRSGKRFLDELFMVLKGDLHFREVVKSHKSTALLFVTGRLCIDFWH